MPYQKVAIIIVPQVSKAVSSLDGHVYDIHLASSTSTKTSIFLLLHLRSVIYSKTYK
jgi:hypothetical protein